MEPVDSGTGAPFLRFRLSETDYSISGDDVEMMYAIARKIEERASHASPSF